MTINLRLQQLIDSLDISVLEFARKLGEHRGEKVYHILHGRLKPRYDTLEKILAAFPQVNGDWLLRGEGLMFKVLNTPSAAITTEERLRNMEFLLFQLNERVALLQQTNDQLLGEMRGRKGGRRKGRRGKRGRKRKHLISRFPFLLPPFPPPPLFLPPPPIPPLSNNAPPFRVIV